MLSFANEASADWRSSWGTAFLPSSFPGLTSIFPFPFPFTFLFASLTCVQLGVPPCIPLMLMMLLHGDVDGFPPLLCVGLIGSQADPGSSFLYVSL